MLYHGLLLVDLVFVVHGQINPFAATGLLAERAVGIAAAAKYG